MKKIFIVALILLGLNFGLAQDKIKVGVIAGATYGGYRGNFASEDFDNGFGFLGGVSFEYALNERIALKTSLSYDNLTANNEGVVTIYDQNGGFYEYYVKNKISHNYITLPLLVKYNFGKNNSFYVNGGPYIGFLVSSKLTSNFEDAIDDDITDSYKKMNGGLSFGIGKKFVLDEKNDLNIEIRDNLGLVNIADFKVVDDGTVKTNYLSLTINWSYSL